MGLVDELRDVVGSAHVLTDHDTLVGYVTDWTGVHVGRTPAVVRPSSAAEVAAVLEVCRRDHVPVVPQGGNTSLVAGAVPLAGEVVMSLARLDALSAVDAAAGQVTAGAGVTLGAVQTAAASAGWRYGIDLSARDTATVGGTVATNAGGVNVIRYGHTRHQLLGIEAVLADGSVVSHLAGLEKDNTGYDLAGLICGSEGTLAVITAARLRLVSPAGALVTALVAFDDVANAVVAASELRRSIGSHLHAVELMVHDGVQAVVEILGTARPFARPHDAYLLVEADDLAGVGEILGDVALSADTAVATDPAKRRALWALRDRHTEAIALAGPVVKLDVTLPANALARFLTIVPGAVDRAAAGAHTWRFGHAADGNVHVNVTGHGDAADRVVDAVLTLTAEMGGSISAEHGIGTLKRRWLHLSRTPEEIAAFRALKNALDPDRILNPNVLLPPL